MQLTSHITQYLILILPPIYSLVIVFFDTNNPMHSIEFALSVNMSTALSYLSVFVMSSTSWPRSSLSTGIWKKIEDYFKSFMRIFLLVFVWICFFSYFSGIIETHWFIWASWLYVTTSVLFSCRHAWAGFLSDTNKKTSQKLIFEGVYLNGFFLLVLFANSGLFTESLYNSVNNHLTISEAIYVCAVGSSLILIALETFFFWDEVHTKRVSS